MSPSRLLCTLAFALLPLSAARADPVETAARQFGRGSSAQDQAALRVWRDAGPAAVPVLRRLLLEESLLARHEDLLETLMSAGKSARPVLEELLHEDRAYWHNLGLNIDRVENVPAVRFRRLEAILRHLAAVGGRDARGTVAAVRELFAGHPVLGAVGRADDSAPSPVVRLADAILMPAAE